MKNVGSDNFVEEVLQCPTLVMVDFWGPGCGPCRMLAPTVEALAAEYEGRVKVVKVNTAEAPDVATHYGISSIPTLLFFKDGNVVNELIGVQSKSRLEELFSEYLV